MALIEKRILKRASRAFKCLPFNRNFYMDIKSKGLNSKFVFLNQTKYLKKGVSSFNSAGEIESDFRWLISIGVLRREVDGQGLTSQVRLTPFGRKTLESDKRLLTYKNTFIEKILFCFRRSLSIR